MRNSKLSRLSRDSPRSRGPLERATTTAKVGAGPQVREPTA